VLTPSDAGPLEVTFEPKVLLSFLSLFPSILPLPS
jgi:hypothetical protein